jgi:ParB-like chromosome segregation protein Spo0J
MNDLPQKKIGIDAQPITAITWIARNTVKPNAYNPNKVAAPEMRLLKLSIMEDGWTQPIVINEQYEIVDGFHRWTVSGDPEIMAMTDGHIPVVIVRVTDGEHQMMSTIRHNRARGTHGVINMAEIIQTLVDEGRSMSEIMTRLQMEEEEVVRLATRVGIPRSRLIDGSDFDKAWVPQ